jgi:alkylation response protein AidB-like acyl-CoA dehydrogenase
MTSATLERPALAISGSEYIARAREIVPLLREQARANEMAGELTPTVVDALIERGLFQVLHSPARGGDVTLTDCIAVLETLATGDGSTSWNVLSTMGAGIFGAFLPEDAYQRVFASQADTAATAVGRIGKAVAVEGGYLVEARWPFLSNSQHASWIGGLCFVFDGDTMRAGEDGSPYVIMPLFRKERVRLLGNWDATGLRGTGSQEAEVQGAFVPVDEVVDFARGPRAGLPLIYSINEDAAAPLAAVAVALGIAAGAVDAYRDVVRGRQHASGVPASEAPLPQLALARAESRLAQARAHVYQAAREVDATLAAGELPGPDMVVTASFVATAAMESAIEVASTLYRAAGTSAIVYGSVLDRALRDLYTMGAHRMLQQENYLHHAPGLFAK